MRQTQLWCFEAEGSVGLIDHPTNSITNRIIGAAIEVHRHLGPGLLESSYHACLCHELELRGVAFASRVPVHIDYKGLQLRKRYVSDILVEGVVLVELKAVDKVLPIHAAQLMTYMRLRNTACGLLVNFNVDCLTAGVKRILL